MIGQSCFNLGFRPLPEMFENPYLAKDIRRAQFSQTADVNCVGLGTL